MFPAYQAIVQAKSEHSAATAVEALAVAYARGENDEFVLPTVIESSFAMADGDAVVFMNFRADRARQLVACLINEDFDGFNRGARPQFSEFVCLSEYDTNLKAQVAFASQELPNTLAEVLSAHQLKQLRIAETEKYAHVTFFFNGGLEMPVAGEDRILIPSPKVATYDLQPEMSCPELTKHLAQAIRSAKYDAIFCNIANPDMVGHTGSLSAAIKAAEAVDVALGLIRQAVEAVGGALLVTADHGNVEMMRDPITGEPHTSHTVGPVYFVHVGGSTALREGGSLRDIAPTILNLLGLDKPVEMTGQSLLESTQ
jgi:2,3-bisphosphoglycerate-independent phosphoglycerate mutase